MLTQELTPLLHGAKPPRRGRPPGAQAQVVRDTHFLGIHHFAFVSSSLLGQDLREAFNRNLAWRQTTTDLRSIQNQRVTLLKSIIGHLAKGSPLI
jgi:hypothetical protein